MRTVSLGDVRAEQDVKMLSQAFYESPDYKTLIESESKSIIVGRRGTGKSALFLKLGEYYLAADREKVDLIIVAAEEHEILALRSVGTFLGERFNLVRAGTRLAFRFALLLEIAESLSTRFKFQHSEQSSYLRNRLREWDVKKGIFAKAKGALALVAKTQSSPEDRIGELNDVLDLTNLESAVRDALEATNRRAVILIDRTDEAYEPDEIGIGIVDGLVQASIDLRDRVPTTRSVIFLRDNIYRAVAHFDQDFTRNLEQAVLRLHWDERALLTLVASRLRVVFSLKAEKSLRAWDSVTQAQLQGEDGFHYCLRLTLYRPRDLLLLLNEAFRFASGSDRHNILPEDISNSAKFISENRLADLIKEYSAQLPGLEELIRSISHRDPMISVADACALMQSTISKDIYPQDVQQQFALLGDPREAIRALYSVGFMGVRDSVSGNFVFCHDGRRPDKELQLNESLLVHPCYWVALNLTHDELDESQVSDIYDEYEVSVKSDTPEQRVRAIGKLQAELSEIEEGEAGWSEFESWCIKVVRVLFATGLRNIQDRPNKEALQRRDIVGTNHGQTLFWGRVLQTFSSSQVLFEVKNFKILERNHYWQMNSYLSKDYGSIGFIITRDDDINLKRDKDLAWAKELRNEHGKVVVKLTAKFLCSLLGKLRNPAKHDAVDDAMDSLLDTYIRNYFNEQASRKGKR